MLLIEDKKEETDEINSALNRFFVILYRLRFLFASICVQHCSNNVYNYRTDRN